MLDSEKLAIAAHLHVAMRRRIGRVTDVEWIVKSPEYAREIIRVARADPALTDLLDLAARLEAALFTARPPGTPRPGGPSSGAATAGASGSTGSTGSTGASGPTTRPAIQRYIGSLR